MGDRYDRRLKRGRGLLLTWLDDRPRIPPFKLEGGQFGIGHNNGPPLDEEPGYLWRRHCWTKAYKAARKNPPLSILKFRVARAEAAGVSYERYLLELLDTGRHLQAGDVPLRSDGNVDE